jgi:ribosome-associated toxin RatA of RatAB toxin-antitoxin module
VSKLIARSALVSFSALQMYELVNDIEAFPEFMDGCVGSEILRRGEGFVDARLDLRKGKFNQSFATRNHLVYGERIEMALLRGEGLQGEAFKSLAGAWQFQNLGDAGSKISLQLKFEFKNRLIALAAEPLFEKIANQLVDSVCQRAKMLYQ